MTSDSERALTPAEEAAAYWSPEDVIRQGGRAGDFTHRAHPYASQEELARAMGEIQKLTDRVAELELAARSRDDYEAEMRDRG